jgi:hypothetical protein
MCRVLGGGRAATRTAGTAAGAADAASAAGAAGLQAAGTAGLQAPGAAAAGARSILTTLGDDVYAATHRPLQPGDSPVRLLASAFIWKVGSCYKTYYITGGVLYHIFLLYNTLYAPFI